METEVASLRIAEQRRLPINAGDFLNGETRVASCGVVKAVPPVTGEGENLGGSATADIYAAFGPVAGVKGNNVVGEETIAGRKEAGGAIFLKDAKGPAPGMVDGVETHDGTIDTDESDGSAPANKGVTFHTDVPGFEMRLTGHERRAEELEAGAAADVDGAAAGVFEAVTTDGDLAGAALGLDTGAAHRVGVAEDVALDNAAVTANHIYT